MKVSELNRLTIVTVIDDNGEVRRHRIPAALLCNAGFGGRSVVEDEDSAWILVDVPPEDIVAKVNAECEIAVLHAIRTVGEYIGSDTPNHIKALWSKLSGERIE